VITNDGWFEVVTHSVVDWAEISPGASAIPGGFGGVPPRTSICGGGIVIASGYVLWLTVGNASARVIGFTFRPAIFATRERPFWPTITDFDSEIAKKFSTPGLSISVLSPAPP
jgi:hypothetical protein